MTNEQKILLKLVSATLNGGTVCVENPEAVDWLSVARESDEQAVLPMAFDAAASLKQNIPEEVYKLWSDRAVTYLVNNTKVETAQKMLIDLLNKAGYAYAILKGESTANYYNRPDLRILGDVDFLIDSTQNDEIEAFLCDNGYKQQHNQEDYCHTAFEKNGICFELHREVQGIPNGVKGDRLRQFFETALLDRKKDDAGNGFDTLAEHHHVMLTILHTLHHIMQSGIGLRHLCDWAVVIEKTQNKAFWNEQVLPIVESAGLMTFVSVVTKTCSLAFKTACPDWADADEDVCNRLLDDVFEGGNFGTKGNGRVLSGVIATKGHIQGGTSQSKYKNMYIVLKNNVKKEHPKVEKYPILYPVFFAAKIFKYLEMLLKGKRPSLSKLSKDIDKRKSIYEQLKIFEGEEK